MSSVRTGPVAGWPTRVPMASLTWAVDAFNSPHNDGRVTRGLLHLRPSSRSPVLVLQLLALPVGYSLIQGGRWAYGVPVVLSALVVTGLLLTRPARAALDRR